MSLSNRLTLLRIALVPLFLLLVGGDEWTFRLGALLVFLAAAVTDYYDGKIARRRGQISDWGKFMDPLADKLLVSSAFIVFAAEPELRIPAWMAVAVISREFIITGLRTLAAGKQEVIAAADAGKVKTATQMTAIVIILLLWTLPRIFPAPLPASLAWLTGVGPYGVMLVATIITLTSAVGYILRYRSLFVGTSP